MASAEKTWGLTPPISANLPTVRETQASNTLVDELRRQGTFESAAESKKRKEVLDLLQKHCDEFVKRVARLREPHNKVLIRDARGQIFTYGSYCLGVYGPGSDIDTLCTAPRYVTRQDFFEHFPKVLRETAPKGAVTDVSPVETAFVPIIKLEYWGISIDLIFSRIATLKQFPPPGELDLKYNEYLRGLDDAELRSLNGTRVTEEILNLVPEPSTFRLALRAIKLWAQRRAVYANIIGFPGGVVWAMLVARVCQLYPRAASATIVWKFFEIIRQWPWPTPIQLKHPDSGPLNVRVWNPKVYPGDKYHLMPVITPAYPQMCATYNITRSSRTIITRELDRAAQIADKILNAGAPWKDLFTKHTFFTKDYKYYLAVIATSKEQEAHKAWSGWVESKVRVLCSNLERHPSIALARPFNKGFDRRHKVQNDHEFDLVETGSLSFLSKEDDVDEAADSSVKKEGPAETNGEVKAEDGEHSNADSADTKPKSEPGDQDVKKSEDVPSHDTKSGGDNPKAEDQEAKPGDTPAQGRRIYTMTHYIGLELAEGAKSLDLSHQVNEFKTLGYGWDKYRDELSNVSFVSVQHVKNTSLPNDVFDPGEVKPTRPLKKPAPNGPAGERKRTAPPDGNAPAPKRQQTSDKSLAAAG